ncbi:MarR family transcriptional regulator [Tsukamurella sp. 8F]|uniref:MarR family winged helix-turn-helix transcriptional regulator n=1 Tax=unclassified Tsukamurella TaxID=2633480 RepID=UPI0023B9F875|nr:MULTISPECIES: MarR family transcriptional regulator [unclassified Tsukamurella]MDF0531634.1 MarR family transcriptional regulator [Tsukamurella sp. 8J]MDF0588798.1 MarR family transcriptional regulator [Tsukamurella sp. 8F]
MSDSTDLRIAVNALNRELRSHRSPAGLTQTQYTILGYLDRVGPATPARLAEYFRVKGQSLTLSVNTLTERGLVSRRQDDVDRRRQFVELTDAGRVLVDEDRAVRDVWLETAMAERLTELERGVLRLAVPVLLTLAGDVGA